MKHHLKLASNQIRWLSLLSDITADKTLINFIVDLDDTYSGADSFLSASELPGYSLTLTLKKVLTSHPKFQLRAFSNAMSELSFFSLGLRQSNIDGEVWDPRYESMKAFVTRHTKEGVLYYEVKENSKIVQHFQRKLC